MVVGNLKSFERCFAVHYDDHQVLWVATNDGILRISGQDTAKFVDLGGRLNGSRITDIDSDKDNNVWIATAGASLIWISHNHVRHLHGDLKDVLAELALDWEGGVCFCHFYYTLCLS